MSRFGVLSLLLAASLVGWSGCADAPAAAPSSPTPTPEGPAYSVEMKRCYEYVAWHWLPMAAARQRLPPGFEALPSESKQGEAARLVFTYGCRDVGTSAPIRQSFGGILVRAPAPLEAREAWHVVVTRVVVESSEDAQNMTRMGLAGVEEGAIRLGYNMRGPVSHVGGYTLTYGSGSEDLQMTGQPAKLARPPMIRLFAVDEARAVLGWLDVRHNVGCLYEGTGSFNGMGSLPSPNPDDRARALHRWGEEFGHANAYTRMGAEAVAVDAPDNSYGGADPMAVCAA